MRKLSIIAWLGAMLLTGCGGSNTLSGSTTPGGTTKSTVTSITVTSSSTSIASDGSDSATITAIAKDANNNFVQGVTVTFSATTGGGLAVTQATTDANGAAIAKLSATAGATVGTAITVTASATGTSGTVSGNVAVNVVNTQQTISVTTSSPQIPSDSSKNATITALLRNSSNQVVPGVTVNFASDSGRLIVTNSVTNASGQAVATLDAGGVPTNRTITVTVTAGTSTSTIKVDVTGTQLAITGPTSLVQGAQGTYNITLTDSSNNGIPSTAVAVSSTNGNTLSAPTVTTDSLGHAAVNLTASKGGNDSVVATALGLSAAQALSVSTNSFAITAPVPAAKINLGSVQPVTVSWTSGGANIPDGTTVSFSTTRGTLSATTATTTGGVAQVTIASTIAGPAVITASGSGVSTQVTVDFVSVTPATIAVQASPSTIPTLGQSTISAVVRDAQNNLVEGQTVAFSTINDITRGTISPATALTDAQGRAQTVYTASNTASASNGVTIQASVQGAAPSISSTTTLTVGGKTVFLSFGTGNKISENSNNTFFLVPYSVQALDSGGNAVPQIQIALTIHSLQYAKGQYVVSGSSWVQTSNPAASPLPPVTVCPNEDANFNGVLDAGEDGCAKDAGSPGFNSFGNCNGKIESGDIASVSPGVVTTDATGAASFTVQYPENYGLWVSVELTATATVTGTQSTAQTTFLLPMLSAYLSNTSSTPPGQPSPFGIAQVCTNPN